jgi:hypothetical protein
VASKKSKNQRTKEPNPRTKEVRSGIIFFGSLGFWFLGFLYESLG